MNIKSYKQYLADEKEGKIICGLKKASIQDVFELADNNHKQSVDDFRPMHLSIIDFDGGNEDLGDYVETDYIQGDLIAGTDQEVQNYMRIFLAKISKWHLVKIHIYKSGGLFYFYLFGADGRVSDYFAITLNVPRHITFQVDIDKGDQHFLESYRVTLKAGEEESKNIVSLEYLVDGVKQYDSIFGEDARGTYELITEA